jgi:hypothetical protein
VVIIDLFSLANGSNTFLKNRYGREAFNFIKSNINKISSNNFVENKYLSRGHHYSGNMEN